MEYLKNPYFLSQITLQMNTTILEVHQIKVTKIYSIHDKTMLKEDTKAPNSMECVMDTEHSIMAKVESM